MRSTEQWNNGAESAVREKQSTFYYDGNVVYIDLVVLMARQDPLLGLGQETSRGPSAGC